MIRPILFFLLLIAALEGAAQKQEPQLSPSLRARRASGALPDTLQLLVQWRDDSRPPAGLPLRHYAPARAWELRISRAGLDSLLANPRLVFAQEAQQAKPELTTGFLDLTLNRINTVHYRYPALRGDSVRVTVKEQSFDTSDIDLKSRVFPTSYAAPNVSAHASIMATIIAGAGNSSPYALGVAPAALLGPVSFSSLLPEADSFFRNRGISVQNHSYGTAIENFYGVEAAAYDAAARNNPSLQFVFSAGNSGTANATSGTYTGLPLSNLTGNFKMAKNILTAGATDSLDNLEAASSRGPAYDGRVKPELVAFGQDGSSGASALVSGAVALVQQAYRQDSAALPPSALVRAVLLNSATDVGNPQVDYSYGFGALNALDAVRTIKAGRFRADSLQAGNLRTLSIQVPAGIRQLRVTLSWTDPAAAANASRALVNNLDGTLRLPASGGSWTPWVLQPAPASLQLPAQRGIDSLNNNEQITVDNPAAGTYVLEVAGTRVTGTQSFSVAWQLDTAGRFEWTYPVAADLPRSGERNVLRWLGNRTGVGAIDYSLDGGAWLPVAAAADLSARAFTWQAPDTFAILRFRLRATGFPDAVSDSVVLSRETNLQTGFNCADSFLLLWDRLPPANYQLYELGDRYLSGFRISTDSFALLRKRDHPSLYYAVAPVVGGRPGLRSFTLKYDAQGVECYFRNFYLVLQDGNRVEFAVSIGTLLNVSSVSLQALRGPGYVDVQTSVPTTTSFVFNDSSLHEGINWYRLRIRLANGADIFSEAVPVYYFPASPVLVFPNPAPSGRPVNVLANESGRYTLQVSDALGRVLITRRLDALNSPIQALSLPAGVYIVRVFGESGLVKTQKLVVL
ncbi:MAG: T9SS type A sorting domain-containing protein [Chitinophagaceae bacterium]|nr:MAG: T9SS type A sorting domain-containing protein [Chitinophagaceae bacterium]